MWNLINYEVGIAQFTGPILESTGINAIFQKKSKKMLKKGEIFENLHKNIHNFKIFWNRAGDCLQLLHAINC